MSNIEFENDFTPGQPSTPSSSSVQFSAPQSIYTSSEPKGMTGWLLKKGIIKEESQAKVILLGVVVFNIVLTIIVIVYFL